ncbi:MAG: hypothetical protein M0R47_21540 [Methylobacter sp.]|jgi:hypothetical protein|uniref:hypothetical protein n=1 Tax=Methylobacter sp. TaxID=2051955 RepID=UPI0025D90B25|nr:hypothetical protein [Methylobacter sp.]MCK9623106.1 hypothetical protein [Methylobacter sp.]
MLVDIQEGNLSFRFEFDAIKFDDSQYYRDHFFKIQNGIRAVDIVAVNSSTAYLIEIKDYRHPETKNLKPNKLIEVIVNKVISTLSAILPMKNNANISEEKSIAGSFSKTSQIKVVLHIETPPPRRTLEQSCYNVQKIQAELRRKLKPIDAHATIVSKKNLKGLPWTVE